jgi:iron complex outermembrane receptor protein
VAGEVSVDVTAQRRQSDGHRDNFDSRTDGVSLAAQWQRPGWRVTAQHAWDDLISGLPGSLSAKKYDANPRQADTPDDRGRLSGWRQSAQAEADLEGWTVSGEVGRRAKASRSVYGGYSYDYDVDAGSWGLRARTDRKVRGLSHRIALGIEGGRWQRKVLGDGGSVADQSQRGIYLRDEVLLPGALRVSLGWRHERIDKATFYKDPSLGSPGIDAARNAWELGLLQTLAPGWQWHGRIGDSFRYANADEYSVTVPGSTLRPQVSRDAELGLRRQHGEQQWALRVWRSLISDELGYDPGVRANVNFDPTRRQGLEAEVVQRLGSALDVRGTLAWRSAIFRTGPYAGYTVPLVPAFIGSLGMQWRPAAGHRIGATLVHASSAHPDLANACVVPSHTTLDLHYAWTVRAWEWRVGVANAANRRYYTQAFQCNDNDTAGIYKTAGIYPEPGRTIKASLRVAF